MGFLPHFKENKASMSDLLHLIKAFLFYFSLFNYSQKTHTLFNYALAPFNYSLVKLHFLIMS
jgi:hypothetical protein